MWLPLASLTGTWPQASALTGNQPANLRFAGRHSIHCATLAKVLFLFFKDFIYLFIYFREKGREGLRGRETSTCERHQLVASHTPHLGTRPTWGPGPQPTHVPPRQESNPDLSVHRLALNPLNHTCQGQKYIFED